MYPRSVFPLALLWLVVGCGGNLASAIAEPPEYDPADQTKCAVAKSNARPLIVEWPPADRVGLEAHLKKEGVVAVRYSGCEMEVLPRCKVGGRYQFVATNPKEDHVSIRDADQLYAELPVGAVGLEAKLEASGELNVEMMIVGVYRADRAHANLADLPPECVDATHIITDMTVGAFHFFSGASTEVGGKLDVGDVGIGGRTKRARETLSRDGDIQKCSVTEGPTDAPPADCAAILRVQVFPIEGGRTQGSLQEQHKKEFSASGVDGNQPMAAIAEALFRLAAFSSEEQFLRQGAMSRGAFVYAFNWTEFKGYTDGEEEERKWQRYSRQLGEQRAWLAEQKITSFDHVIKTEVRGRSESPVEYIQVRLRYSREGGDGEVDLMVLRLEGRAYFSGLLDDEKGWY